MYSTPSIPQAVLCLAQRVVGRLHNIADADPGSTRVPLTMTVTILAYPHICLASDPSQHHSEYRTSDDSPHGDIVIPFSDHDSCTQFILLSSGPPLRKVNDDAENQETVHPNQDSVFGYIKSRFAPGKCSSAQQSPPK